MSVLQRLHDKDNIVTLDDIRSCDDAKGKYCLNYITIVSLIRYRNCIVKQDIIAIYSYVEIFLFGTVRNIILYFNISILIDD